MEKKGFAYPAAALAAADVIVVPSVVDRGGHVDGLPNTLLEALAVGRPVVASRVAGIADVVEDERHGPARAAGRSRGVGGDAALGPPVASIFSSRPTLDP